MKIKDVRTHILQAELSQPFAYSRAWYDTRMAMHVWGAGIAIAASLQLLAVLPSHTPPSLAPLEPMLEFDRTEHPTRQAILTQPIEHVSGIVAVPNGPGLGIEIDRDALARFTAR
jgi:D-galactarolactone cycloisomerase